MLIKAFTRCRGILFIWLAAAIFIQIGKGNTMANMHAFAPKAGSIMYDTISFFSEGAMLRGRLYKPQDHDGMMPVVVMVHGYSATIHGMVADNYAEAFCSAGFAVLLYDQRNIGISDGEPRQQLNRWVQARGVRDAINFLQTLQFIDKSRIGLWGDSMGGDVALFTAAMDNRVQAVVVQVPACGATLPPDDPDGSLFEQLKQTFSDGDIYTPKVVRGPMPVVSFDQNTVPSLLKPLTAWRWFMEYGSRFNTQWVNHATYVEPAVPVKFSSVLCMPHQQAAILMMVADNDEMPGANPEVAQHAYSLIKGPKQLDRIGGGHFGVVEYPSAFFDQASAAQIAFLKKHL